MSYDNSEIAKRMKAYEAVPKNTLIRRMPVILRLDGRSFHTFTRGFNRPFDEILMGAMQETMKALCRNVEGCVLGYTQSDEISLLLIDYKNLNTSAWFDNQVQKMCSVAASIATLHFNREFHGRVSSFMDAASESEDGCADDNLAAAYAKADGSGAMFDCRAFNLPREEVANYFFWRQLDATRNSVNMVGQVYFTQKELINKSCEDVKAMLLDQKKIDWTGLEVKKQRGCCCIKRKVEKVGSFCDPGEVIETEAWEIDDEIPIFKGGDGRRYIEQYVDC